MKELTEKQKNILDFIDDFLDREGMAPTVYEISGHFGIKTSTVFAHLKALQRKHKLTRSSKARSIALTKSRMGVRQMSFNLSIPLLGRINAGMPADSPALREGEVCVSGHIAPKSEHKQLFALRISGESMRDLGILDGDIVIVNPAAEVRTGSVVVALVNNETTVKSFYPADNGQIELRPANEDYASQFYPADAVKLQGRVVGLQREY